MSKTILEALQAAAAQGEPETQMRLAVFSAEENGRAETPEAALAWLIKAAAAGNEDAVSILLSSYQDGFDMLEIRPDQEKLIAWADRLPQAGSEKGCIWYAELMRKEKSPEKRREALERIGAAADGGSIPCCAVACDLAYFLARTMQECGQLSEAEALLIKIFAWLEKTEGTEYSFTERYKAACQYLYAITLSALGRESEGAVWALKAAPWNPDAEVFYVSSLMKKNGSIPDPSLAGEIVTRLLHAVHSPEKRTLSKEGLAYHLLAAHARLGLGMRTDMKASYQWMRRAAELGFEPARQELPRYRKTPLGGYRYA